MLTKALYYHDNVKNDYIEDCVTVIKAAIVGLERSSVDQYEAQGFIYL